MTETNQSPNTPRDTSRDAHVTSTRAGACKSQAPLVPADVDLRDFAFMALDVRRLRDSDLAATASSDAFRAAVLLWCASWHQVPASSLPDDDAILASLAGYGRGEAALLAWSAVKPVALRGFVLAADGRYYHPVIAEKALDAWQRKSSMSAARQSHAERMKGYRARRRPQSEIDDDGDDLRDAHVTRTRDARDMSRDNHAGISGDGDVTSLKGQGQGEREKKDNTVDDVDAESSEEAAGKPSRYPDAFAAFWAAYPRKVGKDEALRSWRAAKKRHGAGAVGLVQAAAERLAGEMSGRDLTYCPHPATWLNQGRFADPETEATLAKPHLLPQNRMHPGAGG